MQLKFNVTNQTLRRTDSENVVSDSVNYLTANFTFSEDWDQCQKTAIFKHITSDPLTVIIAEDGTCTIPWEVIKAYDFSVSVFGTSDKGLITTNTVTVKMSQSGYLQGRSPIDPTPDIYSQLLTRIDEIQTRSISREAEIDIRSDRKLLWHDEFDFFDNSKWTIRLENGELGNNEHVDYKYVCNEDVLSCSESALHLNTVRETETNRILLPRITSKNTFRNCLIEVKMRVNHKTLGCSGGCWMQTLQLSSESNCSNVNAIPKHSIEIDLAEGADHIEGITHNVHYMKSDKSISYNSIATTGRNYIYDWHVYGVEIGTNTFTFYRDGKKLGDKTITDDEFGLGRSPLKDMGLTILLDVCIANETFTDDSEASYDIDWIRVYEGKDNSNPPEVTHAKIMDKKGNILESSWNSTPWLQDSMENNRTVTMLKFYPEKASVLPAIKRIEICDVPKAAYSINGLHDIYISKEDWNRRGLFRPTLIIETETELLSCILADEVLTAYVINDGVSGEEQAQLMNNQELMAEILSKISTNGEYMIKIKDSFDGRNAYLGIVNGKFMMVYEDQLAMQNNQ